jgi:hypothetical protein
MQELHNQLSEKSPLYKSWHEYDSHKLIHWIVFIGIAVAVWAFFLAEGSDFINTSGEQGLTVQLPKPSSVLSLNPQTKTLKVGDTFTSDISLDTAGLPIDGVDIYALHYDPTILKVVDDDSVKTGTQIKPGKILGNNTVNTVDEKTGTIKFGQAVAGGTTFKGKGVLASIHFKAIGKGSSYLKFDFNPGSTVDTNVAHRGKDQLFKVVDAIYVVSAN